MGTRTCSSTQRNVASQMGFQMRLGQRFADADISAVIQLPGIEIVTLDKDVIQNSRQITELFRIGLLLLPHHMGAI